MLSKSIVIAFLAVVVFGDIKKISSPYHNHLKAFFDAECKGSSPRENFDSYDETVDGFINCLNFTDLKALSNEVEAANNSKAALDVIFKKNCEKSNQLKICLHNSLDQIAPCVNATGQDELVAAKKISDKLIDFACDNNGEIIALFISERGAECYRSQSNGIQECFDKVKDLSNHTHNFITSGHLTTAEKCAIYDQATPCIVTALQECETPIPANTFDSLFKTLRKASPCNNLEN